MANTFTQLYIHLVFAVKNRDAVIKKDWKDGLEKYITGIIQNHKHKLLAIGTMPDHTHILVGYNVNQLIPDLVENIKTSSNAWIKTNRLTKCKFEWQKGYGAFSHFTFSTAGGYNICFITRATPSETIVQKRIFGNSKKK